MRNRYRLQIAMVLASIPSLSVARISDEVGFASAAAMTLVEKGLRQLCI
jgi:AraC-like DNA-binding protein